MIDKILVIEHEPADQDGNIKVRKELIYNIAERLNYLQEAISEAKEIMEDYKKEKDFFSSHRLNNDIDLWLSRYFPDTRKEEGMIVTIEQDINLDIVIDFMEKYSASELLDSDWEDLERLERCIKKLFSERQT